MSSIQRRASIIHHRITFNFQGINWCQWNNKSANYLINYRAELLRICNDTISQHKKWKIKNERKGISSAGKISSRNAISSENPKRTQRDSIKSNIPISKYKILKTDLTLTQSNLYPLRSNWNYSVSSWNSSGICIIKMQSHVFKYA